MPELAFHPLAFVRAEHNWSMDDLAAEIRRAARRADRRSGADRNRIWKWESGRVTPDRSTQYLLADVLGVPHREVDALGWPQWLPAYTRPYAFDPAGSRAALLEVLVAHLDRRAFLVLGGGALIGAAENWARTEPERLRGALDGRPVDTALLAWLEERTGELRLLANGGGPFVTDLVDAHLHTVVRLIDQARCTEETGRRLHTAAAALAQSAAWLRFDAGRHGAAQRHWQAALHAAHQAGDRDLGAGVLSDLAYQSTWLARPEAAVQILAHARARTRSPAARSLLDLRRARALAVLQDGCGVARALASAERELERSMPQEAPAWVSWMSPADLAADAGRCWLDLGHLDRAASAIGEGLQRLDPARTRTRAVFLTYRAEGHLRGRDLTAAAADARTALDAALDTGAPRCLDLVRALLAALAAHQDVPEVGELHAYAHDRLAAA